MVTDISRMNDFVGGEFKLRTALAAHENARFDLKTAVILRDRVEDLLETVRLVAHDENLWSRLQENSGPLTDEQLDSLRKIDEPTFAVMLEAAGYRDPPPPPVNELVDETLDALEIALQMNDPYERAQRIADARAALITFTWRVRRQITTDTPVQPSRLRVIARKLGRVARRFIPVVAGLAAGAIVEIYAPSLGLGVGVIVKIAAEKIIEFGVEKLAALLVAGSSRDSVDTAEAHEEYLDYDGAIKSHLAIAEEIVGRFTESTYLPGNWLQEFDTARRHIDRANDLAQMYDDREASARAADLSDVITEALDALLAQSGATLPVNTSPEAYPGQNAILERQRRFHNESRRNRRLAGGPAGPSDTD